MQAMKERPILFSGPMVRAILQGRKTVTRRPVNGDQVPRLEYPDHDEPWVAVGQQHRRYGFVVYGKTEEGCAAKLGEFGACPYGQRGDRLWVRETWQDVHPVQVADNRYSQAGRAGIPGPPGVTYRTIYRADGPYPVVYHSHLQPYRCLQPDPEHGSTWAAESGYTGWVPSIHMPRWASRILLEITTVRVERLQDITPNQCIAEGAWLDADKELGRGQEAVDAFADLWRSTGGDWAANPWVWVVEFKRVTP
ncbi:hypothetical protein [Pseudomonas putida]|uniref:hypothetical protein n=1 Tax=Pseudomonas putida TaxID=303 RepID=UPI000F0A4908|nr:hypothetical protein [Pseudomonas putida]